MGRLRDPADAEAWREFDGRYRELIVRFLRRRSLQTADAEDLAQLVIGKLVASLQAFEYDRERGGFRAYLYRCTRSVLSDHYSRQDGRRGAVSLHDGGDHHTDAAEHDGSFEVFEREWVDHHYRVAVRRYRATVDDRGAKLLDLMLTGVGPRTIAEELGMTEGAVYKAQQRLRDRLKELIAEQLRDEELNHEQRSG